MATPMQYLKFHALVHSLIVACFKQSYYHESKIKTKTTFYENKKPDVKNSCNKQCINQRFQTYSILLVILLKYSDLLSR